MKKTMLSITVLLIAMTLFSCNPDNPDDSTSVKKISIMGDSYSTFEGWSNIDMEGDGHPTYKGMQSICEQVYSVLK